MWRDDGVAFTWEKVEGQSVPDPANGNHVATAVSEEASPTRQSANRFPRAGLIPNGRTHVGESNSLDDGRVLFIPWPRHLATFEMRRVAVDALLEWQIEQWAKAAEVGHSGLSKTHVKFSRHEDPKGLRLHCFALPFEVGGITREQERQRMVTDLNVTYVPWPPKLATAKMRKNAPDEYDEWKVRLWLEDAEMDSSGHSTREVKFRIFPTCIQVTSAPLFPGKEGHTIDRYRQILRPPTTQHVIHQDIPAPVNADGKSSRVWISYPPEFVSKLSRKTPEFLKWVDEQVRFVSDDRTHDGAKRLVAANKQDEGLLINWKFRVEAAGPPVPPSTMLASRHEASSNGSVHLVPLSSPNTERMISPERPPAKRVRYDLPASQHVGLPPVPASVPSACGPEPTSVVLCDLETAMQSKLTAIDNWTNILADYPDRAEAIGKQVERIQGEIFQIRGQMRTEREKIKGR